VKNGPSKKPAVLIFKETLLPVSETFIASQAGHLTQFMPRYVGLGRVSPSLPLPDDSILLTDGLSRNADLRQKLYRRTGFAPARYSFTHILRAADDPHCRWLDNCEFLCSSHFTDRM
jgi:hypothetical protein